MNRREKILAAAVGLLVLLAVLNVAVKRVVAQFTARGDLIEELEADIKSKEVLVHRGKVAQRTLGVYRTRSLPADPVLASSRYRAWLHEWAEAAHVQAANVKHVRVSPFQQVHDRHTFNVTCDATLPQLVDLLYRFYSSDTLHRIQSLTATPAEGNLLSLNFTLEAVSLPDAGKDQPLSDVPAQRLALDSVEAYQAVIVRRNPYAPANEPPKFTSSSSQRGIVNQTLSVTLKADDPEKQTVRYRVADPNALPGLKLDEQSGRLEWTPNATGEYELTVYAIDDGMPPKETSQQLKFAVSEPPPPEEAAPPTRSFDEAKYTFVTGIVEVNGRRQVWLTIRSEGKWLRLFEGDSFQVGSFEGTIVRIHTRHVEIQSGDQTLSVRFGQSLTQGEVLAEGPSVAASAADSQLQ